MIPILFLFANPDNADTLLAGDELRQIEAALKGSRFEVIAKPAARLEDLPELLRQSKAAIVHFSGHGSRYGKLMFVNEQGESQSAPISALANLFKLFKYQVRCVVLNACYSDEQAAAIAEQVECVLGFEGAIRDDAARAFASGFYGALAAGETLARAKEFGLNEIERRYPDALLPCHLGGKGDTNALRPLEWDEVDEASAPATSITYNTAGGAAIGRDVHTGVDFVNRDKIEGDKVEGDKFTGNKTVIQQQIVYQTPSLNPDKLEIRNSPPAIRGIFGQYPFNQHFFGRDDELAQLHTLLQTQNTVSICPVITGMGGLGKTQLAAHYARRHEADYPDGIFWVTAADLNAVRGQLADFCVALGLSVADPQRTGDLSEQKITAFKLYLDEHPKALLIFDNVEEPDHLRTRQIGVGLTALTLGGKLIVTTRRRKLSSDRFVELPLQRLLPEPARQILLTARADLAYDPDINRLCEQFGYLPLMLNLAAAALKKRGGAIVGYLQRLQTLGAERLHNDVAKVSLHDYHKSLSAVLHEQWEMLGDANARLLFRVAGQLPEAEVIPTSRLSLLAGLQDVDEWSRPLSDALEELERASLIEPVDGATLRLHPLVRNFAEELTAEAERNDFRSQCAQNIADTYINNQGSLYHLSQEYINRGIAEVMLDLVVAIEFCQSSDSPQMQSLSSKLQSFLQLIRHESHKLENFDPRKQPLRLWQQMWLRAEQVGRTDIAAKAQRLFGADTYWRPCWIKQSESLELEQTLIGHEHIVRDVAIIDSHRVVSASDDFTLKVWNLTTGEIEQTLTGHEGIVTSVAKLPNGNQIVSGASDGKLIIWNSYTGSIEKIFESHFSIDSIAILDHRYIASMSDSRSLLVWNIETGKIVRQFHDNMNGFYGMCAIDRLHIVTISGDSDWHCKVSIRNLKTGEIWELFTYEKQNVNVCSVAAIGGQYIVCALEDGDIDIWNFRTGEIMKSLSHMQFSGDWDTFNIVAVLDSQHIVSSSNDSENDRKLTIWNLQDEDIERVLVGHSDSIRAIARVDDQRIISASDDKTLKIWNWTVREDDKYIEYLEEDRHDQAINALSAMCQNYIITASADTTLKIWNVLNGELAQSICTVKYAANEFNYPVAMVMAVDEYIIFAIGESEKSSGSTLWTFEWTDRNKQTSADVLLHEHHIDREKPIFAIDRLKVVTESQAHNLHIWNLAIEDVEVTLVGHRDTVNAVAKVDDLHIISASTDRTLILWNLQAGNIEQRFIGHEASINDVCVLNSQYIISASGGWGNDNSIRKWNIATGKVEQIFTGHSMAINAIALIDCNHFVSASDDRTLKVWNLESGKEITSIGLDGAPQCVAVTRHEGRTLVVAGDRAGALYCLELVEPKE